MLSFQYGPALQLARGKAKTPRDFEKELFESGPFSALSIILR